MADSDPAAPEGRDGATAPTEEDELLERTFRGTGSDPILTEIARAAREFLRERRGRAAT